MFKISKSYAIRWILVETTGIKGIFTRIPFEKKTNGFNQYFMDYVISLLMALLLPPTNAVGSVFG